MEGQTIFWMIFMLIITFGPFFYFASLAASKEKIKAQKEE
ncbi:hypothetical protein SAMN05446037_1002337 [Anaerovirgula multivorans]|uniref:Uncharacterized protein n=1 Tax=Anaerovirgula multivorans TaxID=312168 RepID=A0A239AZK1_9FIRM|nr:hypothetical protein SAMN05446037_1002337 [Anaerovirgula multivorans]